MAVGHCRGSATTEPCVVTVPRVIDTALCLICQSAASDACVCMSDAPRFALVEGAQSDRRCGSAPGTVSSACKSPTQRYNRCSSTAVPPPVPVRSLMDSGVTSRSWAARNARTAWRESATSSLSSWSCKSGSSRFSLRLERSSVPASRDRPSHFRSSLCNGCNRGGATLRDQATPGRRSERFDHWSVDGQWRESARTRRQRATRPPRFVRPG